MGRQVPFAPGADRPSLRLAWVNPAVPVAAAEADPPPVRPALRLLAPPPVPTRPVNLALAIERHLAGHDGLSPEEFVRIFSGCAARG